MQDAFDVHNGCMVLPSIAPASIDSPMVRHAGKDMLSLALIDARNHSLHLIGQLEALVPDLSFANDPKVQGMAEALPPLWWLGYTGWFQEWWIGRNTQRARGERCAEQPLRLASIDPRADACFDPSQTTPADRWRQDYPALGMLKAYLLETLETTLELLDKSDESDDALYFFRLALAHEDQMAEQVIVMGQALGLPLQLPRTPVMVPRAPISLPATRWQLGAPSEGFAWDNERAQHEVKVPAFEIDAQPVGWAQFVEFIDDGGYDDAAHWSPRGWQWLQDAAAQEGRRGPRYVDQIGVASGAVLLTRMGRRERAPANSSAVHLSWFEAEAYARWAGRRLATEVEWEIAAHQAQGLGFQWGDVWEWTANTFLPYPGFVAGPWSNYSTAHFEQCKVLRGASLATRMRAKLPTFRGFAQPQMDGGFYGFRTCAW
jgi:gamma-glutamyl hercynylcysteine S-oxide synthase